MNRAVSVTVQPMVMPLCKQHHPMKAGLSWEGASAFHYSGPCLGAAQEWRRGQPSGQVGAVGSQVWPSGPPWLRAGRWQLLSRWPRGFVHHPSLHTPHPCVKLWAGILQKSNVRHSKMGIQRTAKHLQKSKLNKEVLL